MTGRRVTVQIDQLVLRGMAPSDRSAMEGALKAELARALSGGAALGGSMRTPTMRLAPLTPGVSGRALGTELGRTVARGIKP